MSAAAMRSAKSLAAIDAGLLERARMAGTKAAAKAPSAKMARKWLEPEGDEEGVGQGPAPRMRP